MTDPEVTVVVAARDEERLLPWCLRSVRAQRGCRWECVVVDDGSTDATAGIAAGAARRDARFRPVGHERSRGLGAARNTGLAAARAPFVTFLDADDFFFAGSLARRVGRLRDAAPDVTGAYGNWVSVPERSRRVVSGRRPPRRPDITLVSAGRDVPFVATAPVLRTDLVRAIGGFDESLGTAEDADLWSWWLRLLGRLVYVRRNVVAYRRRRGSMAVGDPAAHQTEIRRALANLDRDLGPAPLALVAGPEHSVREQAIAAPRALYAAAQALLDDEAADAEAAIGAITPEVLRLIGPEAAAERAVRMLAFRRRGTRGGRAAVAAVDSVGTPLAALIAQHAAPQPDSSDLRAAAAWLATERARRPGARLGTFSR